MEKFIEYVIKSGGQPFETQKNMTRLLKLLNINFIDLMGELPNFQIIIEKLLEKYTLGTTISILDTMKHLIIYYDCDKIYMHRFVDEYNNLIDLKENKKMYSKFSIFEIKKRMSDYADSFLTNHHSYTQLRTFLVLYLFLFEIPLRLTNWTRIRLEYNDFENLDDFDDYPFYLIVQQNEFYFIFNKFDGDRWTGQHIHKITKKKSYSLLSKFLLNTRNSNKYFITNKSGKTMTNPNLSNAITNFTKEYLGKILSINNLRCQYKQYFHLLEDEQMKMNIFNL
jgi:hypothetical protein|tara:strand:- start:21 stop:863 length:843 start_codon:yes stop_codon:yes gene_type:complete